MDLTIVIVLVVMLALLMILVVVGFLFFRPRRKPDASPTVGLQIKSSGSGKAKRPTSAGKATPSKVAEPGAPRITTPPVAATKPAVASRLTPSSGPVQVSPSGLSNSPSTLESFTREDSASLGPSHKEGKIRLLVVDDNRETIEHVSRLLYFEEDIEIIGQATNGRQGIRMALEERPHIVLMDINMPDIDGITATQELTRRVPFSQVIMISVQSDPEYMKQAMIAGARDYQPKPFTADELISCIRRVYEVGQPFYRRFARAEDDQPQMVAFDQQGGRVTGQNGAVIVIYSPKGGVGTTTIAANLAAVLQKIEDRVVLVDADLQFGDILVHLNTHDTRNICRLVQGDDFDAELLSEVLVPHPTGLKLLLAPPQPEMAELIKPALLVQVIDSLRDQFKIVVIDAPHLLSDQTLAILDKSDHIFIVTTPELPAVKSAKLFLDLSHELNFAAKRMSLIINKADQFGGISLKQIEAALKLPRNYPIPHDPSVFANINSGKVITQQKANTPFARAIVHLAQAIRQELAAAEAALTAETA